MLPLVLLALVLASASVATAQQRARPAADDQASAGDLLPPPITNFYQGRPLHRLGDDPDLKAPEVVSAPDPPPLKDFRPGTVVLWCVIDEDGKVRMIKVARRLSNEADMKAEQNLQQWKFKPALIKKNPVDVLMTVEVVWH
jgi:TonB family protein